MVSIVERRRCEHIRVDRVATRPMLAQGKVRIRIRQGAAAAFKPQATSSRVVIQCQTTWIVRVLKFNFEGLQNTPRCEPECLNLNTSELPARGREINGHSHRMLCSCLSLGLFRGRRGEQLYTLRCIFAARDTSRDNKRLVSDGFFHCARSSLCCSGTRGFVISIWSEGLLNGALSPPVGAIALPPPSLRQPGPRARAPRCPTPIRAGRCRGSAGSMAGPDLQDRHRRDGSSPLGHVGAA